MYGLTPETSKYGLTQEEIDELKLTWGEDYTEDQYQQLVQLFTDMKEAYIIQDPIAISNAKMICKLTVKMNRFLDIDDVESSSKISRQLDTFIKTANLAPVQQKTDSKRLSLSLSLRSSQSVRVVLYPNFTSTNPTIRLTKFWRICRAIPSIW